MKLSCAILSRRLIASTAGLSLADLEAETEHRSISKKCPHNTELESQGYFPSEHCG